MAPVNRLFPQHGPLRTKDLGSFNTGVNLMAEQKNAPKKRPSKGQRKHIRRQKQAARKEVAQAK
jgi:hypothetical protein